MYIDPNTGGMLFQALAVVFTAVTGIVFIFSRRIRSGIAKFRRRLHDSEEHEASSKDENVEE